MTSRIEPARFGVLENLAPELAREIGDAFSMDRIGERVRAVSRRDPAPAGRGARRGAGAAAAFLLVTLVTVSLTMTALYLTRLF